jgi:hypothetical protein
VLVFPLNEAGVDFALVLSLPWDGTWGSKSSLNPMGGRWCKVDFDRGCSRTDTSSTCGGSRPGLARLCWDEGSEAPTTGGMAGKSCPRNHDVTPLPVVAGVGSLSAVDVLQQLPIG